MKTKLMAMVLVAGSSLFAQSPREFRDVRNDEIQLERLRADVARDQFELNRAFRFGDRRAVARIERDLARDQRAMAALERDIYHDRREIREDRFERGFR